MFITLKMGPYVSVNDIVYDEDFEEAEVNVNHISWIRQSPHTIPIKCLGYPDPVFKTVSNIKLLNNDMFTYIGTKEELLRLIQLGKMQSMLGHKA